MAKDWPDPEAAVRRSGSHWIQVSEQAVTAAGEWDFLRVDFLGERVRPWSQRLVRNLEEAPPYRLTSPAEEPLLRPVQGPSEVRTQGMLRSLPVLPVCWWWCSLVDCGPQEAQALLLSIPSCAQLQTQCLARGKY